MATKFGGIANLEYEKEVFDFGNGVLLRKTYAHFFSPYMVAFNRPGKFKHHEGPWRNANGGPSFDILLELEVPSIDIFGGYFTQNDVIWIITSLIKLSVHPYVSVPVISDRSFNELRSPEEDGNLEPNEISSRIFSVPKDIKPFISKETLLWIKDVWVTVATLMKNESRFFSAMRAIDSSGFRGSNASSMVTIWGAIEQLFSSNGGELKFRVASNLAAFLHDPGKERLELFGKLKKLYDHRSTAAHTAKPIEINSLVESYIYLRNALMKVIETNKIPAQGDFEDLLFT